MSMSIRKLLILLLTNGGSSEILESKNWSLAGMRIFSTYDGRLYDHFSRLQRYTIIASPKSRLAADCLFASAFSILSLPSPNSHIPRDKKQFQPGLRHPFGYSSRHMSSTSDIRLLPTDTIQPETVCSLVATVPQLEISFSPARCSGRNVLEETQSRD
jgi:hypothetical protein